MKRPKTSIRKELHQLVDELPADQLEPMRFLLKLAYVPEDDEPETPEEAAAVAEAREALARGEVFSMEEIRREFGL